MEITDALTPEQLAKKLEEVTKDRDALLAYVSRFVENVDRGTFLKDIHWLAADGRALEKAKR
jgi:hypothetical protein